MRNPILFFFFLLLGRFIKFFAFDSYLIAVFIIGLIVPTDEIRWPLAAEARNLPKVFQRYISRIWIPPNPIRDPQPPLEPFRPSVR